jgi:hypothetical protein
MERALLRAWRMERFIAVCMAHRGTAGGCVQAKDVFEAFYKKDFAKRLLMDKSSSIDVEKSIIAKLKGECGAQYTSKLEGMFKDEQVSKDIAAQFKSSEEYKSLPPGMDVNIRVLTSGFWPTYPVVDITLPAAIKKCAARMLRTAGHSTLLDSASMLYAAACASSLVPVHCVRVRAYLLQARPHACCRCIACLLQVHCMPAAGTSTQQGFGAGHERREESAWVV